MELFNIEESACLKNQSSKIGSLQRQSELFLNKYCVEAMQIDTSVVLIPLFGVDIPALSESIRLCSEASRAGANNKVELEEEP